MRRKLETVLLALAVTWIAGVGQVAVAQRSVTPAATEFGVWVDRAEHLIGPNPT